MMEWEGVAGLNFLTEEGEVAGLHLSKVVVVLGHFLTVVAEEAGL